MSRTDQELVVKEVRFEIRTNRGDAVAVFVRQDKIIEILQAKDSLGDFLQDLIKTIG